MTPSGETVGAGRRRSRRLRRMTALALLRDGALALLAATFVVFLVVALVAGEADTAMADLIGLMVVGWLWIRSRAEIEE